jgi:hypothetical protein
MKISLPSFTNLLTIGTASGFIVFSVYLYALGETFRPTIGMVCALVIALPRALYHMSIWKPHVPPRAVALGEIALITLLLLNGFGALALYTVTRYYDFFLHAFSPFFGSAALSILIGSYLHSKKKYSLLFVQKIVIPVVLLLIIIWELWEYAGDLVFGTQMFGQNGERYDTYYDIAAGFAVMIAVLIFNRLFLKSIVLWIHRRSARMK